MHERHTVSGRRYFGIPCAGNCRGNRLPHPRRRDPIKLGTHHQRWHGFQLCKSRRRVKRAKCAQLRHGNRRLIGEIVSEYRSKIGRHLVEILSNQLVWRQDHFQKRFSSLPLRANACTQSGPEHAERHLHRVATATERA